MISRSHVPLFPSFLVRRCRPLVPFHSLALFASLISANVVWSGLISMLYAASGMSARVAGPVRLRTCWKSSTFSFSYSTYPERFRVGSVSICSLFVIFEKASCCFCLRCEILNVGTFVRFGTRFPFRFLSENILWKVFLLVLRIL